MESDNNLSGAQASRAVSAVTDLSSAAATVATATTTTTVTTITTVITTSNRAPPTTVTTTKTSTVNHSATPAMPFRFMDLPPELRLRVYEELVVVGKVAYITPTCSHEGSRRLREYRRPDLTILRVSRQAHWEAEKIYLSKNQFVLPLEFYKWAPFDKPCDERSGILFSKRALNILKHISHEISGQAVNMGGDISSFLWKAGQDDFALLSRPDRREQLHDSAMDMYYDEESQLLDALLSLTGLTTIEFNYRYAYCPMGCCRMLPEFGIESFWTGLACGIQGIRFQGLLHRGERDHIMETWARTCRECGELEDGKNISIDTSVKQLQKRYNVIFGPSGDPWQRYNINGRGT